MRRSILISAFAFLASAAPAAAAVPHVVTPGETLWSIAAANNLTTRTVAAYNGLSEDAQVVLGSTIMVPTTVEGYAALHSAGLVPADPADIGTPAAAAPAAPEAVTAPAPAPAAPPPAGGYTVRPGDTLSGLAAGAGVSVADMAAMNGLDPAGILVAGTVIKLPSGAPAPAQAAAPAPEPVVPAADPVPTPARLSAADVQSVAAQYGVSPSLAAAIAWQESGFNNEMVSSANARGVMQVMPGTWDYVQQNLAQRPLDPASATDNVHAGVMYLKQLLNQTGGDEASAIAGYYQGISSVQNRGMFDDTERYVANVQALRSRFGG
ncbi:MAG TPA: LysM peptidoglycan-binding domain-containing protein [Solirubrobacteraceae bacterium]|nr:LysM peptidoglycan-binding domain-containing protein [Solirubrobacteraceae bacterium]